MLFLNIHIYGYIVSKSVNWAEEVTQGLSVRSCSIVIPKKIRRRNVEIVSNNLAPSLKRRQHEIL